MKVCEFNLKALSLMAWFNSTVVHLKLPAARCVSETRGNTFVSACFILVSKKVLISRSVVVSGRLRTTMVDLVGIFVAM